MDQYPSSRTCSKPFTSDAGREALSRSAAYLEAMLEAPEAFRGMQLRGSGPVAEFETLLALRCGFPHCLAVASATSGLLSLVAAAELKGRRIIVPEVFWSGTRGALRFAGVELVTVRTTEAGNLDSVAVARLLEPGDIAAIVAGEAEHRQGTAEKIRKLCSEATCLYIEDSSLMPGVTAPAGSRCLADVQVMSFGPGKPLTLGEGGAVLTRDRDLYERLVAHSQHPERCAAEGIECDLNHLALNARIHPLSAVIGVALLSSNPIL